MAFLPIALVWLRSQHCMACYLDVLWVRLVKDFVVESLV